MKPIVCQVLPEQNRITVRVKYFIESNKNKFSIFCFAKNKIALYLHSAKGTLAQLVEQRTENPCVPGSIPGGTT